jgi:hypothetical protein
MKIAKSANMVIQLFNTSAGIINAVFYAIFKLFYMGTKHVWRVSYRHKTLKKGAKNEQLKIHLQYFFALTFSRSIF